MEPNIPTPKQVAGERAPVSTHAIDEAINRVESLGDEPISEHVAAFERAHQVLQEHLSEATDV